MELTVYNPQKGQLETLDVEFTDENTTWFENSGNARTVSTITDFGGGLLIKKVDSSYPIWLYDLSRAEIDYSHKKAKQLIKQHV
jgi:hypothetical protein